MLYAERLELLYNKLNAFRNIDCDFLYTNKLKKAPSDVPLMNPQGSLDIHNCYF